MQTTTGTETSEYATFLAGRAAYAAIRKLDRTHTTGRNFGATSKALARHEQTILDATRTLPRDLSGLLSDEDSLARRVAEARAAGQVRPELEGRLLQVRRTIRRAFQ